MVRCYWLLCMRYLWASWCRFLVQEWCVDSFATWRLQLASEYWKNWIIVQMLERGWSVSLLLILLFNVLDRERVVKCLSGGEVSVYCWSCLFDMPDCGRVMFIILVRRVGCYFLRSARFSWFMLRVMLHCYHYYMLRVTMHYYHIVAGLLKGLRVFFLDPCIVIRKKSRRIALWWSRQRRKSCPAL